MTSNTRYFVPEQSTQYYDPRACDDFIATAQQPPLAISSAQTILDDDGSLKSAVQATRRPSPPRHDISRTQSVEPIAPHIPARRKRVDGVQFREVQWCGRPDMMDRQAMPPLGYPRVGSPVRVASAGAHKRRDVRESGIFRRTSQTLSLIHI